MRYGSHVMVITAFVAVAVAGCRTTPDAGPDYTNVPPSPSWAQDVRAVYPDSEYLAFVASGTDESAAKRASLADLAGYFGMSVTAETSASATFAGSDDAGLSLEDQRLVQAVRTRAAGDLVGVEYSDPHYRSDGSVEVVAYIERAHIGRRVATVVAGAESSIAEGLAAIEAPKTTPLQALATALRVERLHQEVSSLRVFLALLNPALEDALEASASDSRVRGLLSRAKDNWPITLVAVGDYQRIGHAVEEAFSRAEVRVLGAGIQGAAATVTLDVEIAEVPTSGDFKTVEWRFVAGLSGADGTTIATHQIAKRASGSSAAAARARAERELLEIAVPGFMQAALLGIESMSL